MIKILVADDHPLVRSGVRATLAQSGEAEIVAEAHDFGEALQLLEQHSPDLLLLDVEMPGGRPEALIASARELLPQLKVLILTSHTDTPTIRALMKAKIFGYILKDEAPEHLLQAVRVVSSGATWFSQSVMTKMMQTPDEQEDALAVLTPREKQILQLLVAGKDNGSIAEEIHLAEQTVRNAVSSIYSKINVSSRVEAVVFIRNRGLFQQEGV